MKTWVRHRTGVCSTKTMTSRIPSVLTRIHTTTSKWATTMPTITALNTVCLTMWAWRTPPLKTMMTSGMTRTTVARKTMMMWNNTWKEERKGTSLSLFSGAQMKEFPFLFANLKISWMKNQKSDHLLHLLLYIFFIWQKPTLAIRIHWQQGLK